MIGRWVGFEMHTHTHSGQCQTKASSSRLVRERRTFRTAFPSIYTSMCSRFTARKQSADNIGQIQWCSASGVVIHEGDDKWKVAERITELLNDDIANRRVIRTILPYILSSPPAPARSVPFVISNLGVIASCDTASLSLISMNASHGLSNSAPCIFVSLHTVKVRFLYQRKLICAYAYRIF